MSAVPGDKNCKRGEEILILFFCETIKQISTKLCWNDPYVVPFQNCVQPFWPPSKMDRAAKLGLTLDTMGNTYTDLLVWNHLLNWIKVITKLPNSEQSYKGKVKTHNYINRQNQSTTGKLWKP